MVLVLKCSYGWTKTQEGNDPKGIMLGILKDIHENTFKATRRRLKRVEMEKTLIPPHVIIDMQERADRPEKTFREVASEVMKEKKALLEELAKIWSA